MCSMRALVSKVSLFNTWFVAESFWSLTPDCILVLSAEFLVDWIKHAFITRFNEVSAEVYKDYTTSLAYDLAQTKQKHVSETYSLLLPSTYCTFSRKHRCLRLANFLGNDGSWQDENQNEILLVLNL